MIALTFLSIINVNGKSLHRCYVQKYMKVCFAQWNIDIAELSLHKDTLCTGYKAENLPYVTEGLELTCHIGKNGDSDPIVTYTNNISTRFQHGIKVKI